MSLEGGEDRGLLTPTLLDFVKASCPQQRWEDEHEYSGSECLSSSHCAHSCVSPSQQQEAPDSNHAERQLDSTVGKKAYCQKKAKKKKNTF